MANELQVVLGFILNKGSLRIEGPGSPSPRRFLVDVAGDQALHFVQDISTTPAALDLAGLAGTNGLILVGRNLDGTNSIGIRRATGEAYYQRVMPGDPFFLRLDPAAPAPECEASAGTAQLEYWVLED